MPTLSLYLQDQSSKNNSDSAASSEAPQTNNESKHTTNSTNQDDKAKIETPSPIEVSNLKRILNKLIKDEFKYDTMKQKAHSYDGLVFQTAEDLSSIPNSSEEHVLERKSVSATELAVNDKLSVDESRQNSTLMNIDISFASERRNSEFHSLFRSVPEHDPLIEDYSCALQRDILIHGRIYLTKDHVCFNSNIFGWVTNLVIDFKDILSIERKMTAFVIPNGIGITTLHAKYIFGSFMYREQAYSTLIRLWRSTLGEEVDGLPWSLALQSDKASLMQTPQDIFSDDLIESEEQFFHAHEEPESQQKYESFDRIPRRVSMPITSSSNLKNMKPRSRSASRERPRSRRQLPQHLSKLKTQIHSESEASGEESDDEQQPAQTLRPKIFQKSKTAPQLQRELSADMPSKQPIFCNCSDHCSQTVLDLTFPLSLPALTSLIYGDDGFWQKIMRLRGYLNVEMTHWEIDQETQKETRKIEYLFPLKFWLGPKGMKCRTVQRFIKKNLSKCVCVRDETLLPDLPNGSSFKSISSQCLMKVNEKETRLLVGFDIEFYKNSFFKGWIEKSAMEGNEAFWKDFEKELKSDIERYQTGASDLLSSSFADLRHVDHAKQQQEKKDLKTVYLEQLIEWSQIALEFLLSLPGKIIEWLMEQHLPSLWTLAWVIFCLFISYQHFYTLQHLNLLESQLEHLLSSSSDQQASLLEKQPQQSLLTTKDFPEWWFTSTNSDQILAEQDLDPLLENYYEEINSIVNDQMNHLEKDLDQQEALVTKMMKKAYKQKQ